MTFPRNVAKALATVTKTNSVYVLSMHNLPDNRLTPDYISTAVSAPHQTSSPRAQPMQVHSISVHLS